MARRHFNCHYLDSCCSLGQKTKAEDHRNAVKYIVHHGPVAENERTQKLIILAVNPVFVVEREKVVQGKQETCHN